jgi:hypothetical protein
MRWIARTSREPDEAGKYIVTAPGPDAKNPLVHFAFWGPVSGWHGLARTWIDAITHWMPLPRPPGRASMLRVMRKQGEAMPSFATLD